MLTLFALTACSPGEEDSADSEEWGPSASEVVKGYSKTLSNAKKDAIDISEELNKRVAEQEKAMEDAGR